MTDKYSIKTFKKVFYEKEMEKLQSMVEAYKINKN